MRDDDRGESPQDFAPEPAMAGSTVLDGKDPMLSDRNQRHMLAEVIVALMVKAGIYGHGPQWLGPYTLCGHDARGGTGFFLSVREGDDLVLVLDTREYATEELNMLNGIEINEWSRLMKTPDGQAQLDAAREEYGRQFAMTGEMIGWREIRTRRGRHLWLYVRKTVRQRGR